MSNNTSTFGSVSTGTVLHGGYATKSVALSGGLAAEFASVLATTHIVAAQVQQELQAKLGAGANTPEIATPALR